MYQKQMFKIQRYRQMAVNYKELKFFEKAHKFVLEIYNLTKEFPKEERFGVVSQLQRASSSICANIAEGSSKTNNDFRRFLQIACGSAKECEYFLLLSKDLKYIESRTYDRLQGDLDLIIGSLIRYIQTIK